MGFLYRLKDLLLLSLFFILMLLGQTAYFILYPFYRGNRWLRLGAVTLLSIGMTVMGGIFYLKIEVRKHPTAAGEKEVIVPAGATLRSVSRLLKEKELLSSEIAFKSLALLRGEAVKLQAGRYVFQGLESPEEILSAIVKGEVQPNNVTITEGATAREIAGLFQKAQGVDSAALMNLVLDSAFARSLGLSAPSLEGYLFPDTYRFTLRPSPREAVTALVNNFRTVYASLRPDSGAGKKFTEREIVTFASIVEAEAAVNSERTEIAGVFHNRLQKNIPLGADPTIRYILNKPTGPLRVSDLKVNSPYNTRLYPGLPPGPVGNPGRASLWAALHPAKTKNLYFVAKADGSREHYFTATHEDHNRMKEVAQANRRRARLPEP